MVRLWSAAIATSAADESSFKMNLNEETLWTAAPRSTSILPNAENGCDINARPFSTPPSPVPMTVPIRRPAAFTA
jgi:hypothetical protein